MGRKVYIGEDKVYPLRSVLNEFMQSNISASVDPSNYCFVIYRGELMKFDSKSRKKLIDFLIKHSEHLSTLAYDLLEKGEWLIKGNSEDTLDELMKNVCSSTPYLICGRVNGNKVSIVNNFLYDISHSNELRQLMNIYKGYEFYLNGRKLGAFQKTPNKFYHGTSTVRAYSILSKGIRPKPNTTSYSIKHTKTVFFTTNIENAEWYAQRVSRRDKWSFDETKPCILVIDASKIDQNKLVFDYDVYNHHLIAHNDEVYNSDMETSNVSPYAFGTYSVEDTKSPTKFGNVGYRGIIYPNSVVDVLIMNDSTNEFESVGTNGFVEKYGEDIEMHLLNMDENVDKDEYVIGGEEDGAVGGTYYHIQEGDKRKLKIKENQEMEVSPSEVDLSSFEVRGMLEPRIWKDDVMDSRVRLELLDIADDFYDFCKISWVEPKKIIVVGSICGYNWYDGSDIDLHLVVDFKEVDDRVDFVREYFSSKKSEWNDEHDSIFMFGHNVELYVQDVNDEVESNGVYDLEKNKWIRKPTKRDGISSDEYIRNEAARIMTVIDAIKDELDASDSEYDSLELLSMLNDIISSIHTIRRESLESDGESSIGNVLYKTLRRSGYIEKIYSLMDYAYDMSHSINESLNSYNDVDLFTLAKERFGSTYDVRECGYVLPDGSMLDFSGRHLINGKDVSHLKGRRSTDHREIYILGWSDDLETKLFDVRMEDFIRMGAIRVHVSSTSRDGFVNLYNKPTKAQENTLKSIIRFSNGCVYVEIGDGDESLSYAYYEYANPTLVLGEINRFFDEGIKLKGNVMESASSEKQMIMEYLEKNHNGELYNYFKWAKSATIFEKASDLAMECPRRIGDYIKRVHYRYPEFDGLLNEDGFFDYDSDEKIDAFLRLLKFYDLCDHFISIMGEICDYFGLPTWYYVDFIRVIKNEWCIHFTSDSNSILRYGFTGGTSDISRLAYTNAGQQKPSYGYNFAFTIDDRKVNDNGYGDEAVIFRTSGVEIYHYGDNENQVIFWGPNVKDIIPIHQDYDGWVVYGSNGQILYSSHKPSDIANWATNNLPQYRKQIMGGKNGFIPHFTKYDKDTWKPTTEPYPHYKPKSGILGVESIQKYVSILKENNINEEVVADGSASHNPFAKRWKAERDALKNFMTNYGRIMTSKENGKEYLVYWSKELTNLIGYNYSLCLEWDAANGKPKSIIYVRAYDKFTPRRFQANFDTRGFDNIEGTMDDLS